MEKKIIYTEDNIRLTYYTSTQAGTSAQTIVCISPLQSIRWWLPLMEILRHEVRFVVFIIRSFPDCDRELTDTQCAFEHHAKDIRRVLEAENIQLANFLGWCFGSKIMLDFYRVYPQSVSSLVGLAVPFSASPWIFKPLFRRFSIKKINRIITFIRKYFSQMNQLHQRTRSSKVELAIKSSSHTNMFLRDFTSVFSPRFRHLHILLEFAQDEESINNMVRISNAISEADVTGVVMSVNVPFLILQGTADDVVPLNPFSEEVFSQNKNIIYRKLEDETHYMLLENPLRVVSCLREFIASFRES